MLLTFVVSGQTAEISEIESSNTILLPELFKNSKEYKTVKQHLDGQLKTALSVPQGDTPEFATSFPWQVCSNFLYHSTVEFMSYQLGVLSVRALRNLVRNRVVTGVQVSTSLALHTAIQLQYYII